MSFPQEPSEAELLRRMDAGDEEAFALLYRRHQGIVYRFAAHMSGSAAIAEDVTQETFLVLMRSASRYDPERGSLQSFLLGVARNCARRVFERERACVSLDSMTHEPSTGSLEAHENREAARDGDDPFEQLARAEALGELRRSISSLPSHYREALVLCELQEMSYDEAAAIIGCSTGTVRSRLHRARHLLGEKMRGAHSRPTRIAFATECLI